MLKPVIFIGSSLKDLRDFPENAKSEAGHAIYAAQLGGRAINAMPLTGFGGASVLEVIIPEDGDAFRAVYTVKFETGIYVLHAFQKKAKEGIKTPQAEMKLIRRRLKDAELLHREAAKQSKEKRRGQSSA